MEVHLRPETESRLQEIATKTGRAPNELIEDAMAGYLQELTQVRGMLDGRCNPRVLAAILRGRT